MNSKKISLVVCAVLSMKLATANFNSKTPYLKKTTNYVVLKSEIDDLKQLQMEIAFLLNVTTKPNLSKNEISDCILKSESAVLLISDLLRKGYDSNSNIILTESDFPLLANLESEIIQLKNKLSSLLHSDSREEYEFSLKKVLRVTKSLRTEAENLDKIIN